MAAYQYTPNVTPILVRFGDGRIVTYTASDPSTGIYYANPRSLGKIHTIGGDTNGHWDLYDKYSVRYRFAVREYNNVIESNPDDAVTPQVQPGDHRIAELIEIKDRSNNATTINRTVATPTYARSQITSVVDATGRTINFTYSNGQVSRITAPGRIFDFSYAGGANDQSITNITYPVLDTDPSARRNREFSYTASNSWSKQIASETDLRGKEWNYSYVSGKCVSFIQPTPRPSAEGKTYLAHQFAYGATQSTAAIAWTLNQFEDPLPTVTHTYATGDPRQRPLQSETDELGFSVTYLFGIKMGPEGITDRRGKLWTYTYDDLANVTSSTTPTGEHEYSTYSADSDLTEAWNDHLSSHTKFFYSNGVLNGAYEPIGNVLRGLYNASIDTNGLPTSVSTYANQGARTFSVGYDAHGSVANVTDPFLKTTTVEVNTLGQPTQVTDALNHSATLTYDSWGRPWKATYADGSTIQVVYDGEGNVVSVTDERGKTSSWTYGGVGNVLTYTNARGDLESYLYNYRSQLIRVTDGNGHARNYTLNNRGDVEKLTLADNTEERWTYDGEGNVLTFTPGHVSGQDFFPEFTIGYEYDNSGRQIKVDYPTGTDTTFSYTNFGRTIGMTDAIGTTTWTYNGRGNLTSLVTPQGNFSYTYDAQSAERLTMTATGIGTNSYEYDGLGRLKRLTNYRNETTQWAFDDAGRTMQRTLHNGDKEEFAYDKGDRLTGVTLKKADQTVLRSQSYGYDAASNVVNHTIDGTTTAYGYDNINQLTSEIRSGYTASYTFDANGNRTSRTLNGVGLGYTYDVGDKLVSAGTETFGYDGIGRMISRSSGSQYVYDYESRIAEIWQGGPFPIAAYGYNGLDARISRSTTTASYTYRRDGAYVTGPVVSDGSATFTPGISEYRGGYSRYFSGGLKNFDTVTGSSGSVAGKRRYDAYGNATLISGGWYGTFGHAGGFGYQEDSESGLQLLGHRYYDPNLGRFLTRDPISADRNWYVYAEGNPVGTADPSGLRPITATDRRRLKKLETQVGSGIDRKMMNRMIAHLATEITKSGSTGPDKDSSRLRATWWAIDRLGTSAYAKDTSYHCNEFVADAYMKGAGDYEFPMRKGRFRTGPISAQDMASSENNGMLMRVKSPITGDVIAYADADGHGGHCGLWVAPGCLIYAGEFGVKAGSNQYVWRNSGPYSHSTTKRLFGTCKL